MNITQLENAFAPIVRLARPGLLAPGNHPRRGQGGRYRLVDAPDRYWAEHAADDRTEAVP